MESKRLTIAAFLDSIKAFYVINHKLPRLANLDSFPHLIVEALWQRNLYSLPKAPRVCALHVAPAQTRSSRKKALNPA